MKFKIKRVVELYDIQEIEAATLAEALEIAQSLGYQGMQCVDYWADEAVEDV